MNEGQTYTPSKAAEFRQKISEAVTDQDAAQQGTVAIFMGFLTLFTGESFPQSEKELTDEQRAAYEAVAQYFETVRSAIDNEGTEI